MMSLQGSSDLEQVSQSESVSHNNYVYRRHLYAADSFACTAIWPQGFMSISIIKSTINTGNHNN